MADIETTLEKDALRDIVPESNVDVKDADEAFQIVKNEHSRVTLNPQEERHLLWKIDLHLMPLLMAQQFLDKTTLSYSSIMGIQAQDHLVGQDYSWPGTIFYFGYLFWEYPANLLMQRLPLAKYTAANVIIWGAVLTCMAAAKDSDGLMVVRFFLGVFKASVTPGFVLSTSQWMVSLSEIVFVLTGLVTALFGVLLLMFMPDSPITARFLTHREKEMAIERIRVNNQGVGNRYFKSYQFREALTDIKASFVSIIP
ncbi:MFS general substrate transporter [Dacryopinax primogenitus]|uniref:MFS general substrate transporter n=1 Tax=Dacryopinax primogenitus (strain DJM 731) TaxID=1858805 RepID=M5FSX7_DACPD|nr:MFS general substrate transporter [Dacryopinax primogenitus]EJT98419.1 MFS general substrate transporter [Dacryopinax primogenitus]